MPSYEVDRDTELLDYGAIAEIAKKLCEKLVFLDLKILTFLWS